MPKSRLRCCRPSRSYEPRKGARLHTVRCCAEGSTGITLEGHLGVGQDKSNAAVAQFDCSSAFNHADRTMILSHICCLSPHLARPSCFARKMVAPMVSQGCPASGLVLLVEELFLACRDAGLSAHFKQKVSTDGFPTSAEASQGTSLCTWRWQ